MNVSNEHFADLSSKFDYLFGPLQQANAPIIIKELNLTPDDLLLDIGAATGRQAHLLWKQVGLKHPITCVEPCKEFFHHASKLDGIVPVTETAEQFCDHLAEHKVANQRIFNKVLLCGVAHYFDNIPKRLGQLIDYLPKSGVCAIFNHASTGLTVPLTAIHLQHFAESPDPFDDIMPYVESRNDVTTKVTTVAPTIEIPKSRWYYMIRNHFWSTFRRYTDEEIEESIKELENEKFKGVQDDEMITIVDKWVAATITKK